MENDIQISSTVSHFFRIAGCLFLGLYLSLIPLPDLMSTIRPDFFVLTLLYMLLQIYPRLSFSVIFSIGIFVDILLSSPIGTHPLAYIAISVITLRLYRQLRFFPMLQQSAYIACIVFIYNLIIFMITYFLVQDKHIMHLFFSWISAFVTWPWLNTLFNKIFHKYSVG